MHIPTRAAHTPIAVPMPPNKRVSANRIVRTCLALFLALSFFLPGVPWDWHDHEAHASELSDTGETEPGWEDFYNPGANYSQEYIQKLNRAIEILVSMGVFVGNDENAGRVHFSPKDSVKRSDFSGITALLIGDSEQTEDESPDKQFSVLPPSDRFLAASRIDIHENGAIIRGRLEGKDIYFGEGVQHAAIWDLQLIGGSLIAKDPLTLTIAGTNMIVSGSSTVGTLQNIRTISDDMMSYLRTYETRDESGSPLEPPSGPAFLGQIGLVNTSIFRADMMHTMLLLLGPSGHYAQNAGGAPKSVIGGQIIYKGICLVCERKYTLQTTHGMRQCGLHFSCETNGESADHRTPCANCKNYLCACTCSAENPAIKCAACGETVTSANEHICSFFYAGGCINGLCTGYTCTSPGSHENKPERIYACPACKARGLSSADAHKTCSYGNAGNCLANCGGYICAAGDHGEPDPITCSNCLNTIQTEGEHACAYSPCVSGTSCTGFTCDGYPHAQGVFCIGPCKNVVDEETRHVCPYTDCIAEPCSGYTCDLQTHGEKDP